jgi:hypothetical protein
VKSAAGSATEAALAPEAASPVKPQAVPPVAVSPVAVPPPGVPTALDVMSPTAAGSAPMSPSPKTTLGGLQVGGRRTIDALVTFGHCFKQSVCVRVCTFQCN